MMEIQEKKEELKKYYDSSKFETFFTEDCESVIEIDFENENVFYYVYVTASCGCCSDTEYKERDLDMFLNYLSDDDYESLLSELKGL